MKQKLTDLYAKNGTKKVLASLLSILAGLLRIPLCRAR